MLRQAALLLFALCMALGAAAQPAAKKSVKADRPAWAELTADQQMILAPLREDWTNLSAERRRAWVGIAKRYPGGREAIAELVETANRLLGPYEADEWHSPSGRRMDLPNRGNIIARMEGHSGNAGLMFMSHTDVVPVEEEGKWRFPPFSATIANDRIYGRGASDCKGLLTAQLALPGHPEALLGTGVRLHLRHL